MADKILQSKSALQGERKQVTVIFANAKSPTELGEQVDAKEWHRTLDRFLQVLAETPSTAISDAALFEL